MTVKGKTSNVLLELYINDVVLAAAVSLILVRRDL
jgi:hypothetical protein